MSRPELYCWEKNNCLYKALPSQIKRNKELFVRYEDYKELDNNFKDLEKHYFLVVSELKRLNIRVKPYNKSFIRLNEAL